jgi:hypothetical protein
MYAFGDHNNPAPDTVAVMEEILMDYMIDVVSSLGHTTVLILMRTRIHTFSAPRR